MVTGGLDVGGAVGGALETSERSGGVEEIVCVDKKMFLHSFCTAGMEAK